MLVQESLHSINMQDDADETLSLSDLPLYGDQHLEEEDIFDESQGGSSSISSSEQDYFEFEIGPTFPPENFIFCGKIIPYTKPVTPAEHVSSENKSVKNTRRASWGVFGWKSTTSMQKKDVKLERKYNTKKHEVGILTSTSSGKPRWHLFLSGISKFSGVMELRDIRSRQSRRRSPPPSPALNRLDDKVTGGRNGGISGLIKVLSCGETHHPNAMVVGSIMRLE